MDGLPPDVASHWSEMKNEKIELRRKRRLLMGFPASEASCRKRSKSNKQSFLPETMLREDDLFFENLKNYVQRAFGVCHEATEFPATEEHFLQQSMQKTVLAFLDDFTTNGLYLLAKLICGCSDVIEKTRWKMKKFIKENMPKVQGIQCTSGKATVFYSKLSHILNNPNNFHKNHAMLATRAATGIFRPTVQSHYDATMIVLDGLKKMSLQTLSAMYRRLKGVKCSMPTLNPPKCGWSKDRLVNRVKHLSGKMLLPLGDLDELPEPLVRAMAVATLSLKLSDNQNASVTSSFCHYAPEIEFLQNEIVKALNLLHCKVGLEEPKDLKNLLAPESEYQVLNGGLRKAIKKMLIEFLFECSDMDEIPSVLLDALAVIKRCIAPQKEVAEEVESILNVSAQSKNILWDFLSDYEFALDFSDAYMEDLVESDDGEIWEDRDEEEQLGNDDSDDFSEVGSTGISDGADSTVLYCIPTWDINNRSNLKSESGIKGVIKADPNDRLFNPSFGVSESYSASMTSTQYKAERLTDMAGTKNSISDLLPFSTPNELVEERKHNQSSCKIEPIDLAEVFPCGKVNDVSEKPCTSGNKYLAMQAVCDEASLIAYRLIGHVFKEYAYLEGLDLHPSQLSYLNGGHLTPVGPQETVPNEDQATCTDDLDGSIIIKVVQQELIPSFSDSELEKVKRILRRQ